MKRSAAGTHLPTFWFFEPAKCPDDRADYGLNRNSRRENTFFFSYLTDDISEFTGFGYHWPVGFAIYCISLRFFTGQTGHFMLSIGADMEFSR